MLDRDKYFTMFPTHNRPTGSHSQQQSDTGVNVILLDFWSLKERKTKLEFNPWWVVSAC